MSKRKAESQQVSASSDKKAKAKEQTVPLVCLFVSVVMYQQRVLTGCH
jgi:hypothetical protein